MGTKMTYPGFHPVARHDGIFQEKIHDTYKIKGKLAEPTVCPVCNAVFHDGRWHWSAAPVDAHGIIARHASAYMTIIRPVF